MIKPRQYGFAVNAKRRIICIAFCVLAYVLTPRLAFPESPSHSKPAHHALSPGSPLIKNASFHSAALNCDMRYRIYLPHNYASTSKRYPVLYLLHGLYGNFENWDTLTGLANDVAGWDWIIVMPDAGNLVRELRHHAPGKV